MSDIDFSSVVRIIKRHLLSAVLAIALTGAIIASNWHYLSERESQLNYRETRLDAREKELHGREDAERAANLSTAKQQTVLEEQRKQLDAHQAALDKWQASMASQDARVGLDAQEAVLRQEADRFVAEYTTLMSKPEIYRNHCARQYAQSEGAPLLVRIDTIGRQLPSRDDLVAFVERQSGGGWSSDCERDTTPNR